MFKGKSRRFPTGRLRSGKPHLMAREQADISIPDQLSGGLILKTALGQTGLPGRNLAKTGFLRPTSRIFSQFIAKPALTIKQLYGILIFVAYMIMKIAVGFSTPLHTGVQPVIVRSLGKK